MSMPVCVCVFLWLCIFLCAVMYLCVCCVCGCEQVMSCHSTTQLTCPYLPCLMIWTLTSLGNPPLPCSQLPSMLMMYSTHLLLLTPSLSWLMMPISTSPRRTWTEHLNICGLRHCVSMDYASFCGFCLCVCCKLSCELWTEPR